jgi:hypothetical protein
LDLNLKYSGLIAARGAFDRAKDVTSQKAAKKLISEELIGGGFANNGNPIATATETVGGIELLNKIRSPLNVPQVPRGLIQR